jgi:hypothetical protein
MGCWRPSFRRRIRPDPPNAGYPPPRNRPARPLPQRHHEAIARPGIFEPVLLRVGKPTLGAPVNQVNATGRPTETRDRSQSTWWCLEWRVRMNHTSQKWPEFGGFSQLRSPLTSFLIGAAASAGLPYRKGSPIAFSESAEKCLFCDQVWHAKELRNLQIARHLSLW